MKKFEYNSYKSFKDKIRKWICCKDISKEYMSFHNETLFVERAPEPNDIIWENLGYSDSFKIKRRFITNLLTLALLGVCFAVICLVSVGQVKCFFQISFKILF